MIVTYATCAAPIATTIGESNKSFGTHQGKDSPSCSFTIINTGNEVLVIKGISKTCGGCVKISVSEKEIAPGKTTEVNLKLSPGTLSGPYSKNFFIETNDPKQRFLMFAFSGTAVPFAETRPSNLIYLGRIGPRSLCRREFQVIPNEKGAEFGEPKVECGYPVEVKSSSNEKGLSIFFGFTPGKNLGDMKCTIKIPVLTPSGWPPLEIIISATIAEDEVIRDNISEKSFGEVPRATENAAVSFHNSFESNSGYHPETSFTSRADTPSYPIIEYFHQAGCSDCRMIDTFVIPKIEEDFHGRFRIEKYDTAIMDNFLRFAYRRDKLNIRGNETVCMIVNGRHALNGYKSIESGLLKQIKTSLKQHELQDDFFKISNEAEKKEILKRHSDKITLGILIIAGLLDGINPCVFSALVFFMSILAISGVKGGKLVFFGSVYCMACFLTYLLLGLGILHFIKLFSGYETIQNVFNLGMVALLLVLAVISFRDALIYRSTGMAGGVLLQLPDYLKRRIHKTMREGVHFTHLAFGATVTGFLVTLLESVCTGQVYLPALSLFAKEYPMSGKWLFYLIVYNVMFIIPLLLVFIAAYVGTELATMLSWSKQNVVIGKTVTGIFFLVLGILILISLK